MPIALERQVRSENVQSTRTLGAALAAAARPGDLIGIVGELGAGKTQLAKGFGAGLGINQTINSPSFVLMAEYAGRLPLFHIDLYRLATAEDVLASGLLDERQAGGVTLIEWPDRLGPVLPGERLDIRIEGAADEPRTIVIRPAGEGHARYLETVP